MISAKTSSSTDDVAAVVLATNILATDASGNGSAASVTQFVQRQSTPQATPSPLGEFARVRPRAITLTRYGGLFEDDIDAAVDRLDDPLGH